MNKEFSAGAVVFKKEKGELLFLLVYSGRNKIWGFPKGHIESGEKERSAALREIREETGLGCLSLVGSFREEDVYEAVSTRAPFKGQTIEKHSIYFLCETTEKCLSADGREITDCRWLSKDEVIPLLAFDSLRGVFKKASEEASLVGGGGAIAT